MGIGVLHDDKGIRNLCVAGEGIQDELNFFRAIYNYLGTMAIAIHYLGAMADATTSMPWLSVSVPSLPLFVHSFWL